MEIASIIDKRFGKLLVKKFIGIKRVQQSDRLRNKFMYECTCDCGATTIVARSNLLMKKGGTLSCGCVRKERVKLGHIKQRGKARPHVQKPNGWSVLHSIFLSYKIGAKKRNIGFALSEKEFADLTSQICTYCGSEPREIKSKKDSFSTRLMNGIDRKNSDLGYTLENCVPCCKICNYMKHELSEEDFFKHINKILSFYREKIVCLS